MIEAGEKTEEYREITKYWAKRFLKDFPVTWRIAMDMSIAAGDFTAFHDKEIHPIYTHVQFSIGYPKKDDESRRMTFELKGIEFREGCEEWGAEKGKKYFVEVLGRRTTLDGTKLWEE